MPRDEPRRRLAIVGKARLLAIIKRKQFGGQRRPLRAPVGADFAKRLCMPEWPERRKYAVQRLLALRQDHFAARRSRRR